MAKSHISGRVEGETNSEKGKRELKEHIEALEKAGKVLEELGYKQDGPGEDTGNEDLGQRRIRKSWVKG